MKKYIFFLIFLKLSICFSSYQTLEKVDDAQKYYIIDLDQNFFGRSKFFENSVHFEWQQLSQLGLPSRGYIKKDRSALVSDLSDLGIHPDKKLVIIGRGLLGRGEEGRVAYTLIKLGFKNVSISTKNQLVEKGFNRNLNAPPKVTKSALFKVKLKNDLTFSREQMKALLSDPKKTITCIDARPQNNPEQPFNLKYGCKKILWKSFFTVNMTIDHLITNELERNKISKDEPIVVLSEAGLSSAGVTLALRELGYAQATVFEGGYSDLRSLLVNK